MKTLDDDIESRVASLEKETVLMRKYLIECVTYAGWAKKHARDIAPSIDDVLRGLSEDELDHIPELSTADMEKVMEDHSKELVMWKIGYADSSRRNFPDRVVCISSAHTSEHAEEQFWERGYSRDTVKVTSIVLG